MTGLSTRVRRAVADRDGGICLRCHARATNKQHRIGQGMGGTSRLDVQDIAAIVSVCGWGNVSGCHGWMEREDRTEAYELGWAIRRSDPRPAYTIPLTDLYGLTFLLTADGRIDPNPSLGVSA